MSPRRLSLVLAALASAMSGGCIASNVVAHDDRMVVSPLASLQFVPSAATSLEGFYESVDITGEAAVSLRRIYYLFRADGTYTAAALVDAAGNGGSFQTLDGTWVLTAGALVLDGGEPVQLEEAKDHVRFVAGDGTVVLRKGKAS